MLVAFLTNPHPSTISKVFSGYEKATVTAKNLTTYSTMVLSSKSSKGLSTIKTFFGTFIFHPVFFGQNILDFGLTILLLIVESEQEVS